MANEIKMPQLSDTMASGKILTWLKKEGDSVNRGDVLAEVETDKANLQIEAFFAGTLLKIVTPAGTTAKVGEPIAFIGAAGESVADGAASATPATSKPAAAPAPVAPAKAAPAAPVASAPAPVAVAAEGDRPKASPLARKIAEQHSVNLSLIQGSGPQGRIVKKDIEGALSQGSAAVATAPAPATARAASPAASAAPSNSSSFDGSLTALSKMRETIARRMQESVTTAPHFYVTSTIDMEEAIKLRETLKERPEFKGISINHLVIKAAAYALEREPRVNFAMKDGQLYKPAGINVGIITAVGEGLLIPVIHSANTLSLRDLVFEAKAAVDRARAGRPSSQDLSGGTFSISNMGMFDVENFTAIINPGQGGILAVSSTKEEAVVKNGSVVIARRMKVTLSVDHRIIDGVMGGTWLKFFKEALETPALMFC